MSVNDGPIGSRQFEANPPFWGSKVASITTPARKNNPTKSYAIVVAGVLAFSVVLGGLYMCVQSLAEGRADWMQHFAERFPVHPCRSPFCGCLRLVVVVSTPKDHPLRHKRWPDRQYAAGRRLFVQ
jgi:hypothetical protein